MYENVRAGFVEIISILLLFVWFEMAVLFDVRLMVDKCLVFKLIKNVAIV
jgi:hypothetical protein